MFDSVNGNKDWEEVVLDLRKSAGELRITHPDAALMRCRKATEAILLSIYEEVYGELPQKYYPYEIMMAKVFHHNVIPLMIKLSFNTAQQWGNFGSHYQHEGPATPENVDFALGPLDNLIQWRFQPDDIEQAEQEEIVDERISQEIDEVAEPVLPTENEMQWIIDAQAGVKGYRCKVCGFRAKIWSHFFPHKIETGHESVKCNICDQYIISASKLNKHKERTGHKPEFTGEPPGAQTEYSINSQRKYLIELLSNAYELEKTANSNWVNLAQIGARVKLIEPEFKLTARQWGAKRWSVLLEHGLNDVFEMRKLSIRHSGKSLKKPTTFEIKPI